MVVSGTLYTPPNYHKALRAQLAAAYSHATVELASYCPNGSNLPSGINNCPADAAPLFHSKDGVVLFDANAIAYFLGDKQIRGGENEHFVTQWVNFTDHILLPSIATWLYPILGAGFYNKQQAGKAKENVEKALAYLNKFLAVRTFFVGENITQADLTVFTAIRMVFEHVLDEAARSHYPHVMRWFTTISHQPEVVKVAGQMKLCDKPAVYDPKKAPKAHAQQKGGDKKQKQQQQQPKKAEPAGDKATEVAPKPKKDALAELPAGTLIYDEFKRVYSNEPIRSVALPFFWEKFDPSTDSIYFCKYMYPEDLSKVYMTKNLINGMVQRLQKMVKYAFGVMFISGPDQKTVTGMWVWRGTGLIMELSPDLQTDYDCYEWTKMDHTDPEQKKLIEEYFSREFPHVENIVFK